MSAPSSKRGVVVLLAVSLGCGGSLSVPASRPPPGPSLAFTDVTVIPMTGGPAIPHATVVIEGDRVARVDTAPAPAGARAIDGHGKYLAPGLADMHVHLPADVPDAALERIAVLSLMNGVTTLRSMKGAPNHLAFRAKVEASGAPSPELYLAGPPLAESFTPEAARARVREQKVAGYDFVKVIGGFDRAAYDAVIDQAREVGMPVVGHVPDEIGIEAALAARQLTVEHLMGYKEAAKSGDAALDALAKRTHDAGVWNCPTLDYFVTLREDLDALERREGLSYATANEKAEWRKREPSKHDPATDAAAAATTERVHREVMALQRAGAGLLVGSDAPEPWILPGFGFELEMRELVKAGLTPAQVMVAATKSAAEALGRGPRDGTIQPGAVADVILVDADPTENVDAATRPDVVVVRGRPWTRAELESRLVVR